MSSIAGSFDVSVAAGGPLYSFINPTSATGIFGALGANASASNPTTAALETGALTTVQHNAIQAIGTAGTTGYTIGWNANGTEPSTLTQLRNYGWIKLTGKSIDADTKTAQGTYVLTKVGQAILNRTNGGQVGSSASSPQLTASELQTAQSTLSSTLSAASGVLSSLGLNVTA